MSVGLTVGNLRALWEGLPDDTVPVVSFAGIEGLVIRSAGRNEYTSEAYMTVGTISPRDVMLQRQEQP